jgi:hypothetical protein
MFDKHRFSATALLPDILLLTRYFIRFLPFLATEYSKLAMGPLWAEIKDIWKFFMNNQNIVQSGDMIPPRLALFSGHDTTIMPVLASLSPDLLADTHWSPYASMLLIEVCFTDFVATSICPATVKVRVILTKVSLFSLHPSTFRFTSLLMGCPIQQFSNHRMPFGSSTMESS